MFKKKTLIIIFLIIILASGGFWLLKGGKKEPVYTTSIVTHGTLKQSVDATGKVESAEKIELNFKTTGRLTNISVKEGDKVKAGQTLATLENRALQSAVDEAKGRLNQAQADYEKLLAGASAEEIKIAADTVAQKEQDLITAKNDLTYLKAKSETDLANLKDTALTTLNNEIIVAQGSQEEIDNTLDDPDAQDTLSVKNSSALTQAQTSQGLATEAVSQSKININSLNSLSANQEVLTALDDLKNTLNKTMIALSDTLDVLSATMTSNKLSETELDTLKSNIKTQQTKINASQTNVQTAKANWTNKITYYAEQIISSENGVQSAEKSLTVSEAQLALKKSSARPFEIKASQAQIEQMRGNLNLTLANLEETIIKAPLPGLITEKNYEVGEQTSLTKPVLVILGASNLEIKVNVPESDIAKIRLGQETAITLDAFGDDKKFWGKVTFIDPAETIIQDVIYYQVKVQFNENQTEVKPGMTANLVIWTDKKENILFVPARAIKSRDGEKYVEVLEPARRSLGEGGNGLVKEKTVTTGLRGDDGIEITSGLEEGEEVVTFVKE